MADILSPEEIAKILEQQRASTPRAYRVQFAVHDEEINTQTSFALITVQFGSEVRLTEEEAAKVGKGILKNHIDDLRVYKVYDYPISLGRLLNDE